MRRRYLFIGERRSARAQRMGVTWHSGRLAAYTLFHALRAAGIPPQSQVFVNLYRDGAGPTVIDPLIARTLPDFAHAGWTLVALGRNVDASLQRLNIPHIAIVHPAARGAIRKRERYQAHVANILLHPEACIR